jgi:chorismate mutase
MISRALLFLSTLFLAACHSMHPVNGDKLTSSEEELARLMCVRLSYAPRIAWIKYQAGQPIGDAARETQIFSSHGEKD